MPNASLGWIAAQGGVFKQIDNGLGGIAQIAEKVRCADDLRPELDALQLCGDGDGLHRLGDERTAGDLVPCKADYVRLNPGEAQHGLNQPFHAREQLKQLAQVFCPVHCLAAGMRCRVALGIEKTNQNACELFVVLNQQIRAMQTTS